jgi:hypothetical protein
LELNHDSKIYDNFELCSQEVLTYRNQIVFLFDARGTGKTTLLKERFAEADALWIDLLDNTLPGVFALADHRDKRLFLKAYADTYLKEEILLCH